ncbi:MAG TPA: class I SAM-dependent methyltransferase [Acetobacteraceae bacterium]|nr:class I SAM-dependent methyltransferase [Acetobacteraceae bacterium]
MSHWDDGYVTNVSYTAGFYREITPSWLAFTALLLGHRHPDLRRPFRWAELGCGQGFTATVAAACHPQAEFWGFDFNPSHIDNATHLAAAAGLDNLHFREASFAELAEAAEGALPQFDFIVLHGIWSWVSGEQQAHLARFIRRQLAPGGLVYVSYNTMPGWGAMAPVQRLLRLVAAQHPGPAHLAVPAAIEFLLKLAHTDALFFQQNALLVTRLEKLAAHDARYVAHEYLNAVWEPSSFDQVNAAMDEARCGFIGSATLVDNMDALAVPPGVGKLIGETTDVVMREMLRDIGAGRAFRRDVYRRGTDQPVAGEHMEMLEAITIAGTGRERERDFQIATGIGQATPSAEIYHPVLERLAAGPLSMRELRAMPHMQGQAMSEALQVVAFLTAAGIAHPAFAGALDGAALDACGRLNRQIGLENMRGGVTNFLAAPRLGSGLNIDPVETLLLTELAAPEPPDIGALTGRVLAVLAKTGRSVMRDGAVQSDPAAARITMMETVTRIVNDRVPVLRRLGILP